MLSVAESASILNVSPARVRALIAEGSVPAQKVGRSWVLREEDVLQRATSRPRPGRPKHASCTTISDKPTDQSHLHEIYAACKEAFRVRPDAAAIEQAADADEAGFYLAVADFFLQRRQSELVQQGVY